MESEALACSYGASVLLRHLAALRQEVEGVRKAEDIEAIHRMRVASRRLRAAIPLFARCTSKKLSDTWMRQIKGITKALGEARDADVQIELLHHIRDEAQEKRILPGLNRLILRSTQRRSSLQEAVQKALDRLDQADFCAQMESDLLSLQLSSPTGLPFPKVLFSRSARAIQACLADFLSYEPYVNRPECAAELHAMRIAAKNLRYTLETFAPLYPDDLTAYLGAVKSAQENLGNLHDCDVWLVSLPQFIDEERLRTMKYYGHTRPFLPLMPGFDYFLKNRQQERDLQYQEFRQRWEKWSARNLWGQLVDCVKAPLYPNTYPAAPEGPGE